MGYANGCFYKEIEIRFCDCDRHKRARIETLLRIMADIAGVAFAEKGYSHSWLWERKTVFLVTRASVRIHRAPAADEKITVETWEREVKGAQYYRDFTFFSQSGEKLVEGATAWVAVDPESRAILRPADFPGRFDINPEKRADTLPVARFKAEGEWKDAGERRIVYSDIDGNQHTYNARYAGIACDVLPAGLLERTLTDFRIHFKQEARLGEILRLEAALEDHRAVVVGKVGEATSFESEFTFGE